MTDCSGLLLGTPGPTGRAGAPLGERGGRAAPLPHFVPLGGGPESPKVCHVMSFLLSLQVRVRPLPGPGQERDTPILLTSLPLYFT